MWNLTVTNIGGIHSGTTTINDGLNVIQASNFRGKSSLIAALRTAIGATGHYGSHPLTEGTDKGEVTLETNSDTHNVMLERVSQTRVERKGTPYITDETDQISARLFMCLDENNPIRRAVRNGEDLTELLQAPLDIEDIDAQIDALKNKKQDIEQQISEAEKAGEQLPAVQERVTSLKTELEELKSQQEELTGGETNREDIERLSDKISAKSSQLANIGKDISRIENEIERKENQISRKEDERDEIDVLDKREDSQKIDELREQREALSRQIDLVEDLYRANQNVVDADEVEVITDVDRSIVGDEVDCWVCGQQTTKDSIEGRIAELQSKTAEIREKKATIETELEKRETQQREIRRTKQKKEQLENKIRQLRADIDERRGILQDKLKRKESLEVEIESLRGELENAEDEYNEELTDVKTEIRTTESDLQSQQEKLESLEQRYGRISELEAERDDIRSSLSKLRNRKKDTQENLKERFNTIISDIIRELKPGFSSARLVLKTNERGEVETIDLEIARDIDSTGQRTTVETLSEGEVELIGLVVALAGYQAFDVDESVPFIMIDGISQLAAEHLRSVATYLDDMTEILVTTAYPEAGDFDGHVIDPDEWDVVSDEPVAP